MTSPSAFLDPHTGTVLQSSNDIDEFLLKPAYGFGNFPFHFSNFGADVLDVLLDGFDMLTDHELELHLLVGVAGGGDALHRPDGRHCHIQTLEFLQQQVEPGQLLRVELGLLQGLVLDGLLFDRDERPASLPRLSR